MKEEENKQQESQEQTISTEDSFHPLEKNDHRTNDRAHALGNDLP